MEVYELGQARKRSWNGGRFAVLQHQKRIIHAVGEQLIFRRIDTFIGQLEGAVMNRDTGLGAQELMCSNSFIRRHMDR